jgi:hypothetical protein
MRVSLNPQAIAAPEGDHPGRCRRVIPEAKVNDLIAISVELSSDAIQHTKAQLSKM